MSKQSETIKQLKPKGFSFWGRVRGYLLTGIIVTAPVAITLYLAYIIVTFIDNSVKSILPKNALTADNAQILLSIPGLGVFIVLVFLILVGFFTANFLGRLVIRMSEYVLHRTPIIKTVYGATKQIMETVMASQSQAFREAVLMEYPRKGVWSIGFITGSTEGEVQRITEEDTVNVFVPTTPNPTSGYLLFVPKKDTYKLHMSIEEAIKLVVSAGIVVPKDSGAMPVTLEEAEIKPKKRAAKKPSKK